MNWSAITGIVVTCVALVLGIAMNGPVVVFVDPMSAGLAMLTLPFALMLAHNNRDWDEYAVGGLKRYLCPGSAPSWRPEESLKAARIATSAGALAIMIGATGMLIGTIQMLQNLEDPSKIGPALAVAGLSVLYGLLINALICMPMAQYHRMAAVKAGATVIATDADSLLYTVVLILALIGLSVGMSFMILLYAMSGWAG